MRRRPLRYPWLQRCEDRVLSVLFPKQSLPETGWFTEPTGGLLLCLTCRVSPVIGPESIAAMSCLTCRKEGRTHVMCKDEKWSNGKLVPRG
jgi:hypothetical protein